MHFDESNAPITNAMADARQTAQPSSHVLRSLPKSKAESVCVMHPSVIRGAKRLAA